MREVNEPVKIPMLNGTELNLLFSQVFGYSATESGHRMGFLVDVPSIAEDDTPKWRQRRKIIMQWARALAKTSFHACMVYAYESMGRRNADLSHPVHAIALNDEVPDTADLLDAYPGEVLDIEYVYSRAEFWIALTEYSVTAPLKVAAARYGFRAATMPGFTYSMLPALAIDVAVIESRVSKLAKALTEAHTAVLHFEVNGKIYVLTIDLRYRMGFALSGRFVRNGQVGNLPAGEAYIVPYEGEKNGIISTTDGILPIEHKGEIALCEISENRIVCIDGDNAWANELRDWIAVDYARANVSELGLGILGEWGIEPVGDVLLDEKLSVHIGLGRSEHIGGVTSPADFKSPANVCHVDYLYHRKNMPHIRVARGILFFDDRDEVTFVVNDHYMFDAL